MTVLIPVMFGVLMGVLIGINIATPEKTPTKRLEDLSDEELSVVIMAVQDEVKKRMEGVDNEQ